MKAANYEVEQVIEDFLERRAKGQSPSISEYVERHPNIAEKLRQKFEVLEILNRSVLERGANPPTETILGDYHLRHELGRGGMGVVFLAEQVSENRLVALKLLPAPSTQRYDTVERFRREAEIASRLRHPNLVSVYAAGERHGYVFYAMQYVEGVTLDKLLSRLRELGVAELESTDIGRFVSDLTPHEGATAPEEEHPEPEPEERRVGAQRALGYYGVVARIVSELADGLAFAHSRGIIHRDVKPANVLLSEDLVPQLADFGVARDVGQKTLTKSGDVVGTPHYMSPELALAGRLPIDHRTDIFSLGVTLFEFLTLSLPFRGETSAEVLQKIALEPTPLPSRINPRVPADLQTIALKALEKDPGHRYANASEMAEDLRRYLRFDPIKARMPGRATLLLRRLAQYRPFIASLAAVVIAAVSFFVWSDREMLRRVQAAQRTEASRLEGLGNAQEPAPWNAARQIWAELLEADGDSAPKAVEAIQRIDRKLEAARAQLRAIANEGEARAIDSDYERGRAVMALDALLRLSPGGDDIDIRRRRNVLWGILPARITSTPVGAEISAHSISEATAKIGNGTVIGLTPLEDIHLPVGGHWIIAEKPGVGYSEVLFDVRKDPTRSHASLDIRIRPTDEVIADMVLIPAGQYRIGIADEKLTRPRLDEFHESEVTIPAFYIDRTEVSNEAYARFIRETGHRVPPAWRQYGNSFKPGTERLPATNVSWEDARLYAEWAGLRLPTEVEWEIACRGAETLLYPWGNEFVAENATPPITLQDRIGFDPEKKLEAVDSRPEGMSPFGLYHMADNASEWVWDKWNGVTPGTLGAGSITPRGQRVIRGEWIDLPGEGPRCLSTVRTALTPEFFATHIGFRCAKSKRP